MVTIENIGGFAAAVDVIVTYSDGSKESFHQSPLIWKKDLKKAVLNIAAKKQVKSIELDGNIFMDADMTNNVKNL